MDERKVLKDHWHTADGRKIAVKDLDGAHLANCINLIEKRGLVIVKEVPQTLPAYCWGMEECTDTITYDYTIIYKQMIEERQRRKKDMFAMHHAGGVSTLNCGNDIYNTNDRRYCKLNNELMKVSSKLEEIEKTILSIENMHDNFTSTINKRITAIIYSITKKVPKTLKGAPVKKTKKK